LDAASELPVRNFDEEMKTVTGFGDACEALKEFAKKQERAYEEARRRILDLKAAAAAAKTAAADPRPAPTPGPADENKSPNPTILIE